MKTTVTNRPIRELLTAIQYGTLELQPPFQRNLVWTNKHKSKFIQTVLDGYPFPEIYIAAGEVNPVTGAAKEMLVDGQQRLTTLYQYFKTLPDLKLLKEVTTYSELSHEEKINFLEYEVVVRYLGKIDDEKMIEIFARINSVNYALNAMEIHNARYDGEIKQFAEELADHSFFQNHYVFNTTEEQRMSDIRFMLSVIITVMSTYFTLDKEFEDYLDRYNDEFKEKRKLETEFEDVFQFIDACGIHENSRAWKKSDLFTLLVEIHRSLFKSEKKLKSAEVGKRLQRFYDLVDIAARTDEEIGTENFRLQEYYKAALQGTNSRTSRINRGKIIKDVINDNFEFDLREK
ncbi:MAG: DUF262 domain-containing protein [Candidatus Poribacteria bacterium]|nr:DUF262 domain-containing protein [Candidatus Poribacteria bacterium]